MSLAASTTKHQKIFVLQWCSVLVCFFVCARPLAGPPVSEAGSVIAPDLMACADKTRFLLPGN